MSKNGSWLKGGIVGVVVGAVAGILFAPKSGKETREDIVDGAMKAKSEAEKQLKIAYKELGNVTSQAKATALDLKGKAKDEVDELLAKANSAQENVKQLIASVREGDEVSDDDVTKAIKKAEAIINDVKKKTAK